MTLRIMLAGLVASMGLELPGGPDVSPWMRSGLDWVHARLADPSGPAFEANRPETELTDYRQADAVVTAGVAEEMTNRAACWTCSEF